MMFVRSMYFDNWAGHASNGTSLENPTLRDVLASIEALDGRSRTTVILSDAAQSDHYMGISGQWNGQYMVFVTKDNVRFVSLVDPQRSASKVTLFVGGQDGEFAERKLVTGDDVAAVASEFFETGCAKPGMPWEEEGKKRSQ